MCLRICIVEVPRGESCAGVVIRLSLDRKISTRCEIVPNDRVTAVFDADQLERQVKFLAMLEENAEDGEDTSMGELR